MQKIYYIEVNFICLILLGIIAARFRQHRTGASAPQQAFRRLTWATAVLCVSDLVAGICRGQFFPGARVLIQTSNLLFLIMMPTISMYWCFFVCGRVGIRMPPKRVFLMHLPLLVFTVTACTNPITRFFFSIDENNLYSRGPGIYLHWIFSWGYLLTAGALSWRAVRRARNWVQRVELMPLLYFLVLPVIGCLMQMAFYGVTSVQAGITLSMILVSMKMQEHQVLSDELTGINNRDAMRFYLDALFARNAPVQLQVTMIDVNRFKRINDTFGHVVGDAALCDTAAVLRDTCIREGGELFLCRFGGDEFLIIGRNQDSSAAEQLAARIRSSVAEFNTTNDRLYDLDFSIGFASGTVTCHKDFELCLKQADEAMYEEKKHASNN